MSVESYSFKIIDGDMSIHNTALKKLSLKLSSLKSEIDLKNNLICSSNTFQEFNSGINSDYSEIEDLLISPVRIKFDNFFFLLKKHYPKTFIEHIKVTNYYLESTGYFTGNIKLEIEQSLGQLEASIDSITLSIFNNNNQKIVARVFRNGSIKLNLEWGKEFAQEFINSYKDVLGGRRDD